MSNPFTALVDLDWRLRQGSGIPILLYGVSSMTGPLMITVDLVLGYAVYQGMFTGLFLLLAAINLRKTDRLAPAAPNISIWELTSPARQGSVLDPATAQPVSFVPSGDRDPLWTKEALGSNYVLVNLIFLQVLVATVWLIASSIGYLLFWLHRPVPQTPEYTRQYDGLGGFFVFSALYFISVCVLDALRTVESVSRERERRTLESLLTLPLDRDEILRIKWLAGLWYFRWLSVLVGCYYLIGVLTLNFHPLAAVLTLTAGLIYFLFFSLLGLWLSLMCRSTLRARLTLGLIVFALTAGPWLLLPAEMDWLQLVINPVACWSTLWFGWTQLDDPSLGRKVGLCLLGLLAYGAAICVLWCGARHRFRSNPLGETH
jgi:ABC-type transport system involved in multi-copper enzyme maturation permease subunit